MKTRNTTNRYNVPIHPGAMTPAELTRRTIRRICEAAASMATVAATIATLIYLFSIAI